MTPAPIMRSTKSYPSAPFLAANSLSFTKRYCKTKNGFNIYTPGVRLAAGNGAEEVDCDSEHRYYVRVEVGGGEEG